jgi:hypothetical protein
LKGLLVGQFGISPVTLAARVFHDSIAIKPTPGPPR